MTTTARKRVRSKHQPTGSWIRAEKRLALTLTLMGDLIMTLTEARERSESHNEIVAVDYESRHANRDADAAMIQGHLQAFYDGEIDSTWENDGTLDIWGYQEETEGQGDMDWRLRVTLV